MAAARVDSPKRRGWLAPLLESPMPDFDNEYEPQDEAEAFDETHTVDELANGSDEIENDPDIAEDVYDVTSALGDADEDETELAADDYDAEDLDDLDLDDEDDADEDVDDDLDDSLETSPEDDEVERQDHRVDWTAGRAAPIEPGMVYVDDVDRITNPRDDDAEKYESTRELSDAQLADLGYRDAPQDEEVYAVKSDEELQKQEPAAGWEDRSFSVDSETALIEGTGARAEHVIDESDPDDEDRLDEGLEETFPASDPVSAKHIT